MICNTTEGEKGDFEFVVDYHSAPAARDSDSEDESGVGRRREARVRELEPSIDESRDSSIQEKNCVMVYLCCRGCKTPTLVMLDMRQRFFS